MSTQIAQIREAFRNKSYGPAPESREVADLWLAKHRTSSTGIGHFIDGEFVASRSKKTFATVNPGKRQKDGNLETLADIALGDASDVERAISAAKTASQTWQALSGHARARFLYAIARHIQKSARLFSVLESLDNGKPIRESRDIDIPLVIRHFYHHAGWAQLCDSEFEGHKALGVVGQIIPWNFPLLMLAWKIAPAIAAGNTVVLKPAEYTPLTAVLFAEVCQAVGLPKGVVNIVHGDGVAGAALVDHPEVTKIAFTGSTDVGKIIRKATAGTGKKLSLELGGKSPFVVFDDADLDSVVEGVVDAIWFNQGQVCCAGSRILVHERIEEKLLRKLRARMEKLRVGNPLDKCVDVGAIVSETQLARIRELVQQGVDEGAELHQPSTACPTNGLYFPPTVLSKVSPSSTVAREEIFGPVVVMMPFRTQEEAVHLANNTSYGLAASVWSENINVALDVAPKIRAGTVWINCTNQFDAASGFGGYKESGFGREGGREGFVEYLSAPKLRTLAPPAVAPSAVRPAPAAITSGIDRTAKLYIGGKQTRPDSGYSLPVVDASGNALGEIGAGNRKDIRNAVEAALAAASWSRKSGHERAQVLFYLAENLAAREADFVRRLEAFGASDPAQEFACSVERIFFYAAWADKYDGLVHNTPSRNVTLAMHEAMGVIAIACPTHQPLLSLLSLSMPALAMGNAVVVLPSERAPLIATDLYQVLDTSDVPAGAFNIVTGKHAELAPVCASHLAIDAFWHFGDASLCAEVEGAAAGNMKRTFSASNVDFFDKHAEGRVFLREATQVKNVWVPYGD